MPIIQVAGEIQYTTPKRQSLALDTFSFSDEDFSIHDEQNVVKQIYFDINPTAPGAGSVTLKVDVGASDSVLDLTTLPTGVDSFKYVQPDFGTTPTAVGASDVLTLTSSTNDIVITGNAITKTINFTAAGKENISNKSTDGTLSANSVTLYPSQSAVKTYVDSAPYALPSNVLLNMGNKINFQFAAGDGLQVQSFGMPNATAGAFNGAGQGNKGFIEFSAYNNLAFSALTALSFTARNIRDDVPSLPGKLYWNLLGNFNTGIRTTADDYVNVVIDGLPAYFTQYFIQGVSHATYALALAAPSVKCVGGTGVINVTATATIGNNFVTGVTNTAALTVGMFFRRDPQGNTLAGEATNPFPDGTTITGLNLDGANTVRLSANATVSTGAVTYKQYGGIAPVSRTGTSNGTTTISGITNTADLQVGMAVNDGGILVQANSYIVSMVANTSITLNKTITTGSPVLNFIAIGKTGIPANTENVGISWNRVVALNPNGYFANTAPTVVGGWTTADGGFPKNVKMSAFNLVMGSSSTVDSRTNVVKSVTINSDTYTFGR